MKKRVICFGEVLWDIVEDDRMIGGALLNVCYHLSKQGIDSRIVSQTGNDTDGADLNTGIMQLGVSTDFITVSEIHPTSKVLVYVAGDGKASYDIVEKVAWDFIEFDELIALEIASSDCFVYGSLITRNEVSKNTLLKYLGYAGWKVLDLNLRTPYYSKADIHQLLSSCFTLKINDEELVIINDLFFRNSRTDAIIESVFKTFVNINEIIVTKGAAGVSYYAGGETITVPGIEVNVADTVGCGDSFLAAYLAGRLSGKPVKECLLDAIAVSAFVAGCNGACPVYDVKKILTSDLFLTKID